MRSQEADAKSQYPLLAAQDADSAAPATLGLPGVHKVYAQSGKEIPDASQLLWAASASKPTQLSRVPILTRQVLDHWSGGKEGARLPIPLDLSKVKIALPTEASVIDTINVRLHELRGTPGEAQAARLEALHWTRRSIAQCPITGQWYCKLRLTPADVPPAWTWFIAVVHPKKALQHDASTSSLTLCHDFRPSRSQRGPPEPWQHRYMFNLKAISLSEAAAVADGTIRSIMQVPTRRKVNFAVEPGELQLVPIKHPSRSERWRVLLPYWPDGPPLGDKSQVSAQQSALRLQRQSLAHQAVPSSAVNTAAPPPHSIAGGSNVAGHKRPRAAESSAPLSFQALDSSSATRGAAGRAPAQGQSMPSPWGTETAGRHAQARPHDATLAEQFGMTAHQLQMGGAHPLQVSGAAVTSQFTKASNSQQQADFGSGQLANRAGFPQMHQQQGLPLSSMGDRWQPQVAPAPHHDQFAEFSADALRSTVSTDPTSAFQQTNEQSTHPQQLFGAQASSWHGGQGTGAAEFDIGHRAHQMVAFTQQYPSNAGPKAHGAVLTGRIEGAYMQPITSSASGGPASGNMQEVDVFSNIPPPGQGAASHSELGALQWSEGRPTNKQSSQYPIQAALPSIGAIGQIPRSGLTIPSAVAAAAGQHPAPPQQQQQQHWQVLTQANHRTAF